MADGRVAAKPPSLGDRCQYIKGVGPAKGTRLAVLGVENINDLLTHYPRKYYDRRHLCTIARLQPGAEETFVGRVLSATRRLPRSRRTIVTAAIGDDTGVVQVIWFNQPYLLQHLKPGTEVIASGELRFYRGERQVVNPEFEIVGDELDQNMLGAGRIVPVYRLTSGVTQRFTRSLVARALETYRELVVETLPEAIVKDLKLPSRFDAIRAMHFPNEEAERDSALQRIKIEELFYMQLVLTLQRRFRTERETRKRLDVPFELLDRFVSGLPFQLTRAQSTVLADIRKDVTSRNGLYRLLQGDVGSGKTVVAGAAVLAAVEAGHQSAIMVPTEILAMQHFRTLAPQFEEIGVRPGLLVGALKAAEKKRMQHAIATGEVDVVIGTHALIQADVHFRDLAMVVIDEQHRFGVRQRAALLSGEGGRAPHMLVMTATPIPRTLALTAYADLDLSVMDEMPAIRAAIKTRLVSPEKRDDMYAYIRDQQHTGAQAYLLYPLVEETEKQDLEAAESAFEALSRGQLKGVAMGLLHGRMSMADKDRVMNAFSTGQMKVLVATTVVEVGVHVPQATIMAIHHPERFGLSQLHQLRGRVGRGGVDGFCFLVTGDHLAPESRARLDVLVRETDGFKIAEEDLRLRGPGEFLGVRQHGVPGFKVANPLRDQRLVERANAAVRTLVEADPRLNSHDGRRCREHLKVVVSEDVARHTVV